MKKIFIMILLLSLVTGVNSKEIFFKEEFNNLSLWKPLLFKKIKAHSKYSIVKQGKNSLLKAEANASASGVIFKKEFNVYKYPIVKWKWKISNILKNGDAKKKSGDDYALRIYILFKYNPEKASFFQKAKYNSVKLLYGEYPPHSSLNYIWANKEYSENIIENTYTSLAQMILVQKGSKKVGRWQIEKIDIIKDYKKAFGENPPDIASLAIMSDTDNTKEKAVAYVDFIEVSGKK